MTTDDNIANDDAIFACAVFFRLSSFRMCFSFSRARQSIRARLFTFCENGSLLISQYIAEYALSPHLHKKKNDFFFLLFIVAEVDLSFPLFARSLHLHIDTMYCDLRLTHFGTESLF